MTYTSPAGNAIGFVFPGAGYSPVSGDAVAFSFAQASGEYSGVGEFSLSIGCDITGAFFSYGPAMVRLGDGIEIAAVAEQPVTGIAALALESLSVTSFCFAAPTGTAAFFIAPSVIAVSSTAVTGEASCLISPRPFISGNVFTVASAAFSFPFSVLVVGAAYPSGKASVPLTISISALGAVGRTGFAQIKIAPRVNAFSVVGRTGSANLAIQLVLMARGVLGNRGAGSVTMSFDLSATGHHASPVFGEGFIQHELAIHAVGHIPVSPPSSMLSVVTRNKSTAVFTHGV